MLNIEHLLMKQRYFALEVLGSGENHQKVSVGNSQF